MKKNIKFIGVAAAALLAVAPVATSVVPQAGTQVVKADNKEKTVSVSATASAINDSVKISDITTQGWIQKNVNLSEGTIAGVAGAHVEDSNGKTLTSTDSLVGGNSYKLVINATIGNLNGNNKLTINGSTVSVNSSGLSNSVVFTVPLTVFNPNGAGIPQFVINSTGAVLDNGAIATIPSGLTAKDKETVSDILKAAEAAVTFRPTLGGGEITTTESDVIKELQSQGVNVVGSGSSAYVSNLSSGFNVTLTGQSSINGKTATVKVPFVPAGAVVTDAPVINVATKPMGQSTFGTATEASKGNQYYQIASGSNFNPLDFTTSNGTEVKFSATQSSKDTASATLTATSNPVNTSEAGKFYHVQLTATNNGKKTSTYSYTVLVVSNGLQELYADAPTYNIYGDNVQPTGQTLTKGTKIYVGNDTKTIGNVSYSKVSTKSKADADAGNLWIKTEALAKPANNGDSNVATARVMVDSRAYDKDGNYLGHEYYYNDNIDYVPEVVYIKGKTYYKVANKDEYVRVTNITGTKRRLRHNAYVYRTSYRRTPGVRKYYKGETVTTYGAAYTFKSGKKFYRITGCTPSHKMYIKKANF